MATAIQPLSTPDLTGQVSILSAAAEEKYAGLAQAVAAVLSPTITAAVDRKNAAGITKFKKELEDQAKCLSELEHHLSDLEDEIQGYHTFKQQAKNMQEYILEKLDDLENRSRRNNLRIIELPKSLNAGNHPTVYSGKSSSLGSPIE